jgi:predicted CoA-binding protein
MNTSKEKIRDFFNEKTIGIIGVSRNEKHFSRMVYKGFKKKGFEVVPVNPKAEKINEDFCYKDLASLPENVKTLIIMKKIIDVDTLVKVAIEKGIHKIWIQKNTESEQLLKLLEQENIPFVSGKCAFMYLEPVGGIHGFHRFLSKTFGKFEE